MEVSIGAMYYHMISILVLYNKQTRVCADPYDIRTDYRAGGHRGNDPVQIRVFPVWYGTFV